jgi:hypothetical protein
MKLVDDQTTDAQRKELEHFLFSDLVRNSEKFAEINKFPTTYVNLF